jgi:hypothetical protein
MLPPVRVLITSIRLSFCIVVVEESFRLLIKLRLHHMAIHSLTRLTRLSSLQ